MLLLVPCHPSSQSSVLLHKMKWLSTLLLLVLVQAQILIAEDVDGEVSQTDKVPEDVELLEDGVELNDEETSEDFYRRRGYGHGHGVGHVVPGPPGVVRTRVSVQRRILRPVGGGRRVGLVGPGPVVDPGFEGSYVAVSGRPGERTVHAVNGLGAVVGDVGPPPAFLGEGPLSLDPGFGLDSGLPLCSYINTDFAGDDVGDGRGLTTGSVYACKAACIDNARCRFWTFRAGWARDCYLKRGDDRGDLRPDNVVPRRGFVSGTVGSRCVCLQRGGNEICPVRVPGGRGFPWRRLRPRVDYDDYDLGRRGGARFDYDDFDDDDNNDREVVVNGDNDDDDDDGDDDGSRRGTGSRRRNRNRSRSSTGRRNRRRNRNRGNNDDDTRDIET